MPEIKSEKAIDKLSATAVKLCDILGKKYHSSDGKIVEEDSKGKLTEINGSNRLDYPQIVTEIKKASPQCAEIKVQVVSKIRERYSVDDEIGILRTGKSAEFDAWNDYVEECRTWGREQKADLGL